MRFVDAIKTAFYALENPENAQWMGRYMRHKYLFIGIKKPERAVVFKDIYKKYGKAEDWYEVSSELFAMPEREFQYVAIEYVLKAKKSWDPRVPMLVNQWAGENSWWDVVDVLGPKVLGGYFQLFPQEQSQWILTWMDSPIFLASAIMYFVPVGLQKTDRFDSFVHHHFILKHIQRIFYSKGNWLVIAAICENRS